MRRASRVTEVTKSLSLQSCQKNGWRGKACCGGRPSASLRCSTAPPRFKLSAVGEVSVREASCRAQLCFPSHHRPRRRHPRSFSSSCFSRDLRRVLLMRRMPWLRAKALQSISVSRRVACWSGCDNPADACGPSTPYPPHANGRCSGYRLGCLALARPFSPRHPGCGQHAKHTSFRSSNSAGTPGKQLITPLPLPNHTIATQTDPWSPPPQIQAAPMPPHRVSLPLRRYLWQVLWRHRRHRRRRHRC